ncbi:MAG: hypothetical protein IIU16_03200 [Bacteroidales bacterium]|nr:hypothetical protein [Bacteroidales bacterium]
MKKILTYIVFPIIILALAFLLVRSIQQPVKFNKEKSIREAAAIVKLKDIRTLQVAYKNVNGKFAPSIDSLIDFYKNGKMTVIRSIGSMDDSLAVAQGKVMREAIEIFVKDTLLKNRPDFNPDQLKYIPFTDGKQIIMNETIKEVSGVDVPLFEAKVPYVDLLNGMDHQQVVNLVYERCDTDRYPGLQVGSIENPNNNAGNWE